MCNRPPYHQHHGITRDDLCGTRWEHSYVTAVTGVMTSHCSQTPHAPSAAWQCWTCSRPCRCCPRLLLLPLLPLLLQRLLLSPLSRAGVLPPYTKAECSRTAGRGTIIECVVDAGYITSNPTPMVQPQKQETTKQDVRITAMIDARQQYVVPHSSFTN